MIEGQFKGVCGAIAKGPMADGLGLIVECFYRTIIDWNLKVAEDVLLVAPYHPGEIPHGL